jgi:Lon protease-like protein
MRLPLHIFEPRYKIMIARCLAERLEFGMILAANQAVATVGCTAEILHKAKDYSDGRMDIVTEGRAVFRLTELLDEKEYYEGVVDYVDDQPCSLDADSSVQLKGSFDQSHVLLYGTPWVDTEPSEPATLAYRMAALVPMELEKRQSLLEMRSEEKRRELVFQWLEAFVPKLADRRRARGRAGGNGHALN